MQSTDVCMKYWYWKREIADKADALKLRNEKEKESLMQHWQYLVVETGWFGLNSTQLAARLVNGQELKDWKKTPLHLFLTQLGADGWEMTGTISVPATYGQYLFFKRP